MISIYYNKLFNFLRSINCWVLTIPFNFFFQIRIFLLFLAEIDFFNCIVTMPTEIYVMLNYYYFRSAFACSMSRFFTYTYNNSTSVIFVIIAVDRYIRICHPHKASISVAGSRTACFVSLCVAGAVSWPALFLYGNKYVWLENKNSYNDSIAGVICEVKNKMDKTPYPLMYFIYLWCGFTLSLCILTILYICIARVIVKRKRKKRQHVNVAENCNLHENVGAGPMKMSVGLQQNCTETNSFSASMRQRLSRGPGSTLMLFCITAVFLLSFLPFLIIMTLRQHTGPSFYPSLSPWSQVIVNLMSRSYLVNSCANPLVYGLCNSQFRQEVCKLFRRGRKQRSSSLSQMETWQDQCNISC